MKPALERSCPKCHAALHLYRASVAVVCPACRQGLRMVGGQPALKDELPMPPLHSHRFNLGTPLRFGPEEFVVAAIFQSAGDDGSEYTEYTLFSASGTVFLEEGDDDDGWTRYVPLPAGEEPRREGDSIAVGNERYKLTERYALKTITGIGEFDDLPEAGEKFASEFFEAGAGIIACELDSVSWRPGTRARWFRVETVAEADVMGARSQGSLGGGTRAALAGGGARPARASALSGAAGASSGLGGIGKVLTWIAVIGVVGLSELSSCDSPSCEERAKTQSWTPQQLQECRNTRSRSGGYSGGK